MDEFKKMQKVAGLITENQNDTSFKKIRFEDFVDLVVSEVNASLEDIGNDGISKEEVDKITTLDELVDILVLKGFNNEMDTYDFIIKSIIE